MTVLLKKKDYKIIWINSKNSEKVIIEIDREVLDNLLSRRKRLPKNPLVSSWLSDKNEWVLKSKTEINSFLNSL